MARSKKATNGKLEYWKAEKQGDSITGKFLQFQEVKDGMVLVLSSHALFIGTVIRQFLAPIASKLRPTDTLTVTYTGKNGRTKLFDVELNGVKLERDSSFTPGTPASDSAMRNFFSDDFVFAKKEGD